MAPDSTEPHSEQARLIASLRAPAIFGRECVRVTVLETHISYVLLTGKHAYKIKKNVNLGFWTSRHLRPGVSTANRS